VLVIGVVLAEPSTPVELTTAIEVDPLLPTCAASPE
jgi:hypothetical protein